MDKEKYLIFGAKLTSEDVDNSDLTVQTTTSLVNPVSLLNATSGTDGIIEVQIKAHANHTFGSAYGSIAGGDFAAGDYVTINTSGYTVHASNGKVTIITAATDAVNGVTTDWDRPTNTFTDLYIMKDIEITQNNTLILEPREVDYNSREYNLMIQLDASDSAVDINMNFRQEK